MNIAYAFRKIKNNDKKVKIDWEKGYSVPNPYNLPVHDQAGKNNCTSHAIAAMAERHLSDYFKEKTLIDVDDLWQKQREYGTATEEGDIITGPITIMAKYGARFRTDSGKTGTMFVTGQNIEHGWLTVLDWKVKLD